MEVFNPVSNQDSSLDFNQDSSLDLILGFNLVLFNLGSSLVLYSLVSIKDLTKVSTME